ncbi:MAG: hypothetical protein KTR30_05930 [Saprospiraceae bacterium]|nr:hypothetical protein [Saprospiraceae bacterium]
MNRDLLCLFSFVLVFISSYAIGHAQDGAILRSPVGQWEETVSYEGRFRILSPGKMDAKADTVKTPLGALVYHTFYFHTNDKKQENYVYMLSYCDYPELTVHSDSLDLLQDFFHTTIETAVSSVRGELMYSTDTDLDDYPAKLWRIDYLNGRGIIKTKAVVVDNRYYAVQTVTQKGRAINQSSDAFLDSFRLLK